MKKITTEFILYGIGGLFFVLTLAAIAQLIYDIYKLSN